MDSCYGSIIDAVERKKMVPTAGSRSLEAYPRKTDLVPCPPLSHSTSSGPGDELRNRPQAGKRWGDCLGTEASESKMFEPLILEAYMLL